MRLPPGPSPEAGPSTDSHSPWREAGDSLCSILFPEAIKVLAYKATHFQTNE